MHLLYVVSGAQKVACSDSTRMLQYGFIVVSPVWLLAGWFLASFVGDIPSGAHKRTKAQGTYKLLIPYRHKF